MNERDIFIGALQLEDLSARQAYLEQACGTEAALRERLESLLKVYDRAGSFLESPVSNLAATRDEMPIIERPGMMIGPYKLMEQIGEGGMGMVFVAEQQQPMRPKGAVN